MTLPDIDPTPEEHETPSPARRRRQRRVILPQDSSERAALIRELARRTVPSFDFFLFSLLSGLVLGAALLLDAPALFVLAALFAPFMAPAAAMALGALAGTAGFLLQALGSIGIGSLIVFLCGTIAGWAATMLPAAAYQQSRFYSQFSWPYFLVLVTGAALAAYQLARAPQQRPLVASVAVAYGLYPPAAAAGFGLISGAPGLWPDGLVLYLVHLAWAVAAALLALVLLRLRPLNAAGFLLSVMALLAAAGVLALARPTLPAPQPQSQVTVLAFTATQPAVASATSAAPSATPSAPPSPTTAASSTPSPTPTRTLVPTRTATITYTPEPTPVFARISAEEGGGALIREQPDYTSTVVSSVLNDTLVEVLPDTVESGGAGWVRIRLVNGREGWVVRSLLRTATPAPDG